MRRLSVVLLVFVFFGCIVTSVQASTYTQTKYPIILVPGVMGWDELLGFYDYFYGIQSAIESSSNGQRVHLISLSAWMQTEERGIYLKEEIENLCARYGYAKVNIIAHSHGSTTSRVAMSLVPEKVASLTTIAGPHYGTPFADYAVSLPPWLVSVVTAGVNLTGDLTALFSAHCEWLTQQDSQAVLNDFTQQGMVQFNAAYPCAGVPDGGSYFQGSYGGDAASGGAPAGDGRGNALSITDPNAIRYYSFTGNIGHGAVTNILDVSDVAMMVTNLFNELEGYYGDADGFIPVSSSHFGDVIYDNYYWSHLDEINQFMGLRALFSSDPITVYRQHANRLKLANL